MKKGFSHIVLPCFFLVCVLAIAGCSDGNEYEIKSLEELENLAKASNSELRKTIQQGDFEFTVE